MYRGWFVSYEQRRAIKCRLEALVKGLDAARRGSYKDRILLMESHIQSKELQAVIREDCERMQERLADSGSQVEELTMELATRQRLSAASEASAERKRCKEQERLAKVTRKFNALRVEEVSLKAQLGLSIAGFRTRLRCDTAVRTVDRYTL